mmetsp:Transcript_13268/g.19287  ORF Transcript_13268/g.19287 Transcript_13268/m.19287 type:complete len:102 (-) Transcript_13268:696-1001(-)
MFLGLFRQPFPNYYERTFPSLSNHCLGRPAYDLATTFLNAVAPMPIIPGALLTMVQMKPPRTLLLSRQQRRKELTSARELAGLRCIRKDLMDALPTIVGLR